MSWGGYNAFHGRHGATALPHAATLATGTRFFEEAGPMHALVAGQDGALHTANRTAMYLYDQLAATSGFLHYYRKL